MTEDSSTGSRGPSRRDVLRRGGVVLGLAWSVPVIQSLASPAFASGSQAQQGLCDSFVFIKVTLPPTTDPYFENSDGSCDLTALTAGLSSVTYPTITSISFDSGTNTATGSIAGDGSISAQFNADGSVTVTAPADCRIYRSLVKLGKTCQTPINYSPPLPRTLTFTSGPAGTGSGLSHVDLILCCNP